jgi:hypothetical protein
VSTLHSLRNLISGKLDRDVRRFLQHADPQFVMIQQSLLVKANKCNSKRVFRARLALELQRLSDCEWCAGRI